MLSRDTDLSTSDLRSPLKFFSTTISNKGTTKDNKKETSSSQGQSTSPKLAN